MDELGSSDTTPSQATKNALESTTPRTLRDLTRDEGGAIFAEYVTLLVLVSLGAASATAALGAPLLRLYRYAQMIIAVPFP